MSIVYCQQWSRHEKQPINILDDREARSVHNQNKFYTVIINNISTPKCFLEINLKESYVGVNFLDAYQRDYLVYSFQSENNKSLFLSKVITRKYKNNTKNITSGEMLLYKTNGCVARKVVDYVTNQATKEYRDNVDVSLHWEAIPEFGDYLSISRINRDRL